MRELLAPSEQQVLEPRDSNAQLVMVADDRLLREARERSTARMRLLWNERGRLFRAALWGLALGTAIAFLIPKRYMSTARLMPPDQNASGANAMLAAAAARAGSLAGLAEGALGLKRTGDLFVGILESDTVRDDLIQRFDLQTVYGTGYREDAREELARHTAISADPKSGIIAIAVVDRDARRAMAMAQEYVDELNLVVSHLSTSAAHRERAFLQERIVQVKEELETSEKDFSQFASRSGAIDIKEQGKAMVTAAATLQGELIATESELQGLRQIYTDNNVRVRATEARAAELKHQLEQFGGSGTNDASGIQSLYPPIRQLPLLGVSYADLYRKVKVEEAVLETLTQEYELAKVEEAKEIPTVKVLDAPEIPLKKSFPPRLLIALLGTGLAVGAGTASVLGHAAWEVSKANDPRKALISEVWREVHGSLPWASANGSGTSWPGSWLKKKFHLQMKVRAGAATEKKEATRQDEEQEGPEKARAHHGGN